MGGNVSSIADEDSKEFVDLMTKLDNNTPAQEGLKLLARQIVEFKYKNFADYRKILNSDKASVDDIYQFLLPFLNATEDTHQRPTSSKICNTIADMPISSKKLLRSKQDECPIRWVEVPNKNLQDARIEFRNSDESSSDSETESPRLKTVQVEPRRSHHSDICLVNQNNEPTGEETKGDYASVSLGNNKRLLQTLCKNTNPLRSIKKPCKITKEKNRNSKSQCLTCKKLFSNLSNLRRHEQSHAKNRPRVKCPAEGCHKDFADNSALKDHTRSVHDKKCVRCSFCHNIFANRGCLHNHMKRKHAEN